MLSLLSGPYSLIARIVGTILVVVGIFLFGYVKGISHQQTKDDLAKAEEIQKAEDFHQKQMVKAQAISKQYQEALQHEKAHSSDLNRALKHALGLRIYVPADSKQDSSDRPSPASPSRTSDVDARFSEAVQHDASLYGSCVNQLNALIDTIHATQ